MSLFEPAEKDLAEETDELLRKAEDVGAKVPFRIMGHGGLKVAVHVAADVKNGLTSLEQTKKDRTHKLRSKLKDIDSQFAPALKKAKESYSKVRLAISYYMSGLEDQRWEVLSRLETAVEEGQGEEVTGELEKELAALDLPPIEGLGFTRSEKIEVDDPDAALAWAIETGRLDLVQFDAAKLEAEDIGSVPGVILKRSVTPIIRADKVVK